MLIAVNKEDGPEELPARYLYSPGRFSAANVVSALTYPLVRFSKLLSQHPMISDTEMRRSCCIRGHAWMWFWFSKIYATLQSGSAADLKARKKINSSLRGYATW